MTMTATKKKLIYDGLNNKVNNHDVIGTIVPQNSRWGMTNGYKIIEISDDDSDTGSDRERLCGDQAG